jgi:ABC-type sugar transport system ATPase subunit
VSGKVVGQEATSPIESRAPYTLQGISRSYGSTQALSDCSFDIRSSEIHALVGENGSGKSTLVKLLSGVLSPDGGRIVMADGTVRTKWKNPKKSAKDGIFTVFQETLVADGLSVVDNIWLGFDGEFRRRLPLAEERRLAASTLAELSDNPPVLDAPTTSLDLGGRQLVVIARALVRDPQLLILDESTSALDISDREKLFDVLRSRRVRGRATLFISHRMDEILTLSDRITVLRGGLVVVTQSTSETTASAILSLMTGRDMEVTGNRKRQTLGATVLEGTALTLRENAAAFDFVLRAGEVVGVAGLEGHGQDDFIQSLCGLYRPFSGSVKSVAGAPIRTLRQASQLGIVYVPRDRKSEGIFEPLSILENFSMPTRSKYLSGGFLRSRRQRKAFEQYTQDLRVKYGSLDDPIVSLSGGNQQKVIIARWLASDPSVVVLNDPTRGVDQATKQDIYSLIDRLCSEGVSVVILSTEIEELVVLADRTIVFHEFAPFAELPHETVSARKIVNAMFGHHSSELPEEAGI